MNKAKIKKLLDSLAQVMFAEARAIERTAKEIDVQRGVFLIKSTFGYDVELDGVPFGMDLSYSEASNIRDTIEAARIKNGRPPSCPNPAKAE